MMSANEQSMLTGMDIELESNDPDSRAVERCESGHLMSQELYEIAKHVEQVIYRDAKAMDRGWMESISALSYNLEVWIHG